MAEGKREGCSERAAASRHVHAAQREAYGTARGRPPSELGLRARAPVVRDEQLVHESSARADRALDAPGQIRCRGAFAPQEGL